jgi:hypothetical protein
MIACINEEIKGRLNTKNSCYCSVHLNFVFPSAVYSYKTYKRMILSILLFEYEPWYHILRKIDVIWVWGAEENIST